MTDPDEKTQEKPIETALEQQIINDREIIDGLQFYSSPIRFNSVLFEGFKIILEKLVKIESKIVDIEAQLTKIGEKKE